MPNQADASPVAVLVSTAEDVTSLNKFVSVQTIEDLSYVTRDFSNLSDPEEIRKICSREIPSWKALKIRLRDIQVEQLMAGLTNQLFKCSVPCDLVRGLSPIKVLFRVYGSTVSDLYDTEFEVKIFRMLGEHDAAPRLIASFPGGRIEEWVDGNPLLNSKMSNPSILCGVATILSKFHQVDSRAPEFKEFYSSVSSLEKTLDRWCKKALDVFERVELASKEFKNDIFTCEQLSQSSFFDDDALAKKSFTRIKSMTDVEVDLWRSRMLKVPMNAMLEAVTDPTHCRKGEDYQTILTEDGSPGCSSATSSRSRSISSRAFINWLLHDLPCPPDHPLIRISFCHNDVQENNIMVTGTTLRLIDFEYANYNFPAFDVANFFCEMTMDYCVEQMPWFVHVKEPVDFPKDEIISLFGSVYLSERLQLNILPSNPEVEIFVKITKRFVLASHLMWSLWSVIRAPQAGTNSEFDFVEYARSRFAAYVKWREYLEDNGLI